MFRGKCAPRSFITVYEVDLWDTMCKPKPIHITLSPIPTPPSLDAQSAARQRQGATAPDPAADVDVSFIPSSWNNSCTFSAVLADVSTSTAAS